MYMHINNKGFYSRNTYGHTVLYLFFFIFQKQKSHEGKNLDATNTLSPVKRLDKNIKNQVYNEGVKQMNDFGTLDLQDSYDESSFKEMTNQLREIRSAGGSRRFMKVRQLDKKGEAVDPITPDQ